MPTRYSTLLRPVFKLFLNLLPYINYHSPTYSKTFLMMERLGRICGLDALDQYGVYGVDNKQPGLTAALHKHDGYGRGEMESTEQCYLGDWE